MLIVIVVPVSVGGYCVYQHYLVDAVAQPKFGGSI